MLPQDVFDVAPDILRHRLVLSYEALAQGTTADQILSRLLSTIPAPRIAPSQDQSAVAPGAPSPAHGSSGDRYAPPGSSTSPRPTGATAGYDPSPYEPSRYDWANPVPPPAPMPPPGSVPPAGAVPPAAAVPPPSTPIPPTRPMPPPGQTTAGAIRPDPPAGQADGEASPWPDPSVRPAPEADEHTA